VEVTRCTGVAATGRDRWVGLGPGLSWTAAPARRPGPRSAHPAAPLTS